MNEFIFLIFNKASLESKKFKEQKFLTWPQEMRNAEDGANFCR